MIAEDNLLRKLEGIHTVETVAAESGIRRQSAINLLSRLKKEGYATVSGGGRQKRLYTITARKQRKRSSGMFDIINRYSHMKIAPWFDHQAHGAYGAEEALIDAIATGSFRTILASLRLFSHIKDWPKLYRLANEKGCWQKVGALYEVARTCIKAKRMPSRYLHVSKKQQAKQQVKWQALTQLRKANFPEITNKWRVYIPFNEKDLEAV